MNITLLFFRSSKKSSRISEMTAFNLRAKWIEDTSKQSDSALFVLQKINHYKVNARVMQKDHVVWKVR